LGRGEGLTYGDHHDDGRDSKGQRIASFLSEAFDVLSEDGGDERGNEGAGVDGEVEDGEKLGELELLLGQLELVTAEGRDAGLDATGAHGDQQQPQHRQSHLDAEVVLALAPEEVPGRERQQDAPESVNYRQVEYRAVRRKHSFKSCS